jgi:hypothetical protein
VIIATMPLATPPRAELLVANDPAFAKKVSECVDNFDRVKDPAGILDTLRKSKNKITITASKGKNQQISDPKIGAFPGILPEAVIPARVRQSDGTQT